MVIHRSIQEGCMAAKERNDSDDVVAARGAPGAGDATGGARRATAAEMTGSAAHVGDVSVELPPGGTSRKVLRKEAE
jgi:hypothetical protein